LEPEDRDVLWIDSHAHLTMFAESELDDVLQRAADRGVRGVLVPSTGRDDLDDAVRIAAGYPGSVVAAVGVHPHDAATLDTGLKRRIELALDSDEVVAIGEIGLDYHYMNSPREDQLAALSWQLDLALAAGMPVVLHNRESWTDLEAELARRSPELRGVAHSFTEGPMQARRIIELGLVVGISGMVTFKQAGNIRETVAALQPEQVMVETDSPFLAPVPHRGQRNEPAFVVEVGGRLAREWALEVGQVAAATTAVFRDLFRVESQWPAV
jgi:TatD DNase family protein